MQAGGALEALRSLRPDVVLLCVKPHQVAAVLEDAVKPYLREMRAAGQALPDIYAFAAGLTPVDYLPLLGEDVNVACMTPNMLCAIEGRDVAPVGVCFVSFAPGHVWPAQNRRRALAFLRPVGTVLEIAPEIVPDYIALNLSLIHIFKSADGAVFPAMEKDFAAGPDGAESYIGKIAALLYARYQAGALPVSLVSMDNCSHNGSRLFDAVTAFAAEWVRRGLVDAGFAGYVNDRAKVGFPWTMIDKITPRPDAKVIEMVRKDGFTDTDAVKTAKGTFVAPFVNAEETQYLVIEDWFPNGRVEIGGAYGVMYDDRETVDKVERMKVCTCLNPLHTALAVYGCLLGYTLISEEMKDPQLKKMVEIIGYREGLPVVVDPGVLDPRKFIDTGVKVRIPNVFMPDTPQRIATDTSQKLAIRFGETIKAYQKRPDLSVSDLKIIPLVFAGWLRYVCLLYTSQEPGALRRHQGRGHRADEIHGGGICGRGHPRQRRQSRHRAQPLFAGAHRHGGRPGGGKAHV